MTYDTRNRILQIGVHEEVELTNLEHKLLICLSSGETMSYPEIKQYLKIDYNLSRLRRNLEVKTGFELKIKNVYKSGYRLESEIYFK